MRRERGFTLVEAMVVVTVLAIVAAVAVPGLGPFVREQRIRMATFDLVADLMLARSEAIMRASPVTLAGEGRGWVDGWIVRVDGGLHAGTLVQRRGGPGAGVGLSGVDAVAYDANGRIAGGGTARIEIADTTTSTPKRCVEIDLGGMPRSRSGAC